MATYKYKVADRKKLAKSFFPAVGETKKERMDRRRLLYKLVFCRCFSIEDYTKQLPPESVDKRIKDLYSCFRKKTEKDGITPEIYFQELCEDGFDYENMDYSSYVEGSSAKKEQEATKDLVSIFNSVGIPKTKKEKEELSVENLLNIVKKAATNFAADDPVWAGVAWKIIQQEHPDYRDNSNVTFTPADYERILKDLDKSVLDRIQKSENTKSFFSTYEEKYKK